MRVPKKEGLLPLLFPILGALCGGVAGTEKAVSDVKTNIKQLEEQKDMI